MTCNHCYPPCQCGAEADYSYEVTRLVGPPRPRAEAYAEVCRPALEVWGWSGQPSDARGRPTLASLPPPQWPELEAIEAALLAMSEAA